jgi:CubicO group peptidase (beta-lactamase class C family)
MLPVEFLIDPSKSSELSDFLARQKHNFGSKRTASYSLILAGIYLNEVVKRAHPNHLTIGQLIEELINEPLGVEIHLGLTEEQEKRFSPMLQYPGWQVYLRVLPRLYLDIPFVDPVYDRNSLLGLRQNPIAVKAFALLKSVSLLNWVHTREYRSCELPAANAFTSAINLAKLGQVMALGGAGTVEGREHQLLSEETWREAHRYFDTEFDETLLHNITRSVAGFARMTDLHPSLQGAVGWVGMGGAMFVWNPNRQLSFAYVPKAPGHSFLVDKRAAYLYDAILKA